MISFLKNVNIGLYSDFDRLICFKLGLMIETTKLYIFILIWMTLTFIQGHSCMKKNLWGPFSRKFKGKVKSKDKWA